MWNRHKSTLITQATTTSHRAKDAHNKSRLLTWPHAVRRREEYQTTGHLAGSPLPSGHPGMYHRGLCGHCHSSNTAGVVVVVERKHGGAVIGYLLSMMIGAQAKGAMVARLRTDQLTRDPPAKNN